MLRLALSLVGIVLAIGIVALSKPKQIQITRSVDILATPDGVYGFINDLRQWARWHPQQGSKSQTRLTYGGPPAGVGATSEWKGAGNAGEGRMRIVQSDAPTRLVVEVDWQKPFVARNINEFSLAREGDATRVTWSMSGPNLLVMRLMSMFIGMDRMMGRHFEEGLAALKAAAESRD